MLKTIQNESLFTKHVNIPVDRFGRCNSTVDESLWSFGLMLLCAGELELPGGHGSVLQGDELLAFESRSNHVGLPCSEERDRLAIAK
jgi:hypothetical protein